MDDWRDRIWTHAFWRTAGIAAPALTVSRLLWDALSTGVDRQSVVLSVFNGLAVGGAMGVGATFRAKRERALAGPEFAEPAAELALGRALRTGVPPADPALTGPLRRLVDIRLRGHRHNRVGEVVVGLFAAGSLVAAAVSHDARWLVPAVVFGAMGLFVTVVTRRQHERLLALEAALPPRESFGSYMAAKAGS